MARQRHGAQEGMSQLKWIKDSQGNIIPMYKIYKMLVKPAMLYGLETVALTKTQEKELEAAEMKGKTLHFSFGFSLGVTRLDKIKNK